MDGAVSFGRLVKDRRRALDLTQEDLAKRIGYAVVTVRKVEADERRPSRQLAERLARELEIPAEQHAAFLRLARRPTNPTYASIPQQAGQRPSVPVSRASLPSPLTRSIGRDDDAADVRRLFVRDGARLVTLVGPPGIGKTRLAVQVAGELASAFADGVHSVALAPLGDAALVVPTIVQALGLTGAGSAPSLVDGLIAELRDLDLLLVLDNFEHLLSAAPVVSDLLANCPGLRVLATSREPLRLRGERVQPVPPLALPAGRGGITAADAARSPAVELFVERAQAVSPQFALTDENAGDVAAICAAVDGVPLSIELVAARIRLLPPRTLLTRLHSRLAVLTDGPRDLPPRQRTLRAALDWSFDLLSADERALFAQLAVFAGPFTLEAAEAVAPPPEGSFAGAGQLAGLTALVDKNLLRQEAAVDAPPRFAFLETIREYAQEHLAASGAEEAVRARFADYYLRRVEAAAPHLTGEHQEDWLDQLDAEHVNLRSAISWYLQRGLLAHALRFCAAIWRFWHIRSHGAEAMRWLRLALDGTASEPVPERVPADREGEPVGEVVRAQALYGAGWIAIDQRDRAEAKERFEQSLALFRSLDYQRGVAEALHGVATMAQLEDRFEDADALLNESLARYRDLGDDEGTAWTLDHLGLLALNMGDLERAQQRFEESRSLFEKLRHAWGGAIGWHHLGLVAMERGDHAVSTQCLRNGLAAFQDLANDWGVATSLTALGYAAVAAGEHSGAAECFAQAVELTRSERDRAGLARSLAGTAHLAVHSGDLVHAALLLGAVEAVGSEWEHLNPGARRAFRASQDAVTSAADPSVARARARGRAMQLSQAADIALRHLAASSDVSVP
ncbi:MAG TPA: tetratricopeptide repeat protein [Micromonosporaceae bacterium]|nr:tetratricopeptide repeat protein [Micromonosporaceae bacterium]